MCGGTALEADASSSGKLELSAYSSNHRLGSSHKTLSIRSMQAIPFDDEVNIRDIEIVAFEIIVKYDIKATIFQLVLTPPSTQYAPAAITAQSPAFKKNVIRGLVSDIMVPA